MKVLIDADGCPVVDIAVNACNRRNIPCLIICDTAHLIHREGAQTVIVDQGSDSTDFALINRVSAGDIVITQDYGLASMCLARKATVIHQDGWEYTCENIDALLLVRHNSQKVRASGGRTKGPKKRTKHQNEGFSCALEKAFQNIIQG